MRGTEGYTGRYVWKLSVLFDLGRRRGGAAAPCIHWEDPVLSMASGVCKAYIRGALESDWFWNKPSQAPTRKDGTCLRWLTVSNKHLKLPKEFPIFLMTHLMGQVFHIKSVNGAADIWPDVECSLSTQVGGWGEGHHSATTSICVEDLASVVGKPFLVRVPSHSPDAQLRACPLGVFGTDCRSTWNEWSQCTWASTKGHRFMAEVNTLEWKSKGCFPTVCGRTTNTKSQREGSWPLQPCGYFSQSGSVIFIWQWKCTDIHLL